MSALMEKSKQSGESILFYVIVVGILVVGNIVGLRLFTRLDLTENKQYSLSDVSKDAVRDLDDRLVVKAYFTKDLPPPFNTTERYVRDLLSEYESHSRGKMKVIFIDPSDEKKAEEARKAGITEVTHQVIEKDQASEKKGFRGLLFSYMGDTQKIPVIADTKGLEYDITNIILMMSGGKRPVGFLQGHGEPKTFSPPQDPNNPMPQEPAGLKNIREELKQYTVREITLSEGTREVPEELEALVVVAPQTPISEMELYRIDQFLMRGGNLALFVEGVRVDTSMGMLSTTEAEHGWDDFLAHYGVRVNKDAVFDPQCDTLPIRGPLGIPLAKRYPGWPVAEIHDEHPTTFRLPLLTFPWVSSIELVDSPGAGKLDTHIIAQSTPDSWREAGSIDLDPNRDWKEALDDATDRGPFTLAVAVEGRMTSYFSGKEIPAGAKEDPDHEFVETADEPGRILVAGSGQMVLDPVVDILQRLHGARERSANLAFAVNTVDWLSAHEGLIDVRGKGVENPRLNIEDEKTRRLLKWGNIIAWPLLVVLLGVLRWILRIRRRGDEGQVTTPSKDEEVEEEDAGEEKDEEVEEDGDDEEKDDEEEDDEDGKEDDR